MFHIILSIFDVNKEILLGFSLTVLYITYYLLEAVKKPVVVCSNEEMRSVLDAVPLLHERYWPTPWCLEARLQTVLGSVLRSVLLPPVSYTREVMRLSDGGQVALDWVEPGPGAGCARAVVVVLPGLTGATHAEYVRCVAGGAARLGARCVVFNYRGLGGLPLATPRLYSAVSHADLAEVAAAVGARHPGLPLLAVGVSLGGLILGQYLAHAGRGALLAGALVVSSPLDVERAALCMESAGNAPLAWHMARNLRAAVLGHASLAGHHAAVGGARTVRQFDAAFTAAHFGFGSVEEYYAAATLRGKLGRVAVPLACLCAADDPFQPARVLPAPPRSARVALCVTARGGHIGFLEGLWPARRPADQYVARLVHQYFAALLDRPDLLHRPDASS